MSADTRTRQIIVRLLSNMGGAREIRQYLERFSCLETSRFAVVKVGGAVLRDEPATLASSLSFLHSVGLIPIVVHGAGPQLDTALHEAGIETPKRDGKRVTSPEALQVVRQVMLRENLMLVEALQALGSGAVSITAGVFSVDYLDRERYGLVGRVLEVNLDPIRTAISANSMPVLCCLGETPSGQILNINGDTAANSLVRAVRPYKIVFLTRTGGLLDDNDQIISTINLTTDFDTLRGQPWLHSGMKLKLGEINDLLSDLPLTTSVSITHPAELTRELFTHQGAGTLIRLGEPIEVHRDWANVDLTRLRGLLNSGFGGMLAEDYFEATDLHALYVSSSYRAAAVVANDERGDVYLDKFAVVDGARAEGLGRTVWESMRDGNAALFWRARRDNQINAFYFDQADGFVRRGEWNVYWYGIDDLDRARQLVERLGDRPATISYRKSRA